MVLFLLFKECTLKMTKLRVNIKNIDKKPIDYIV